MTKTSRLPTFHHQTWQQLSHDIYQQILLFGYFKFHRCRAQLRILPQILWCTGFQRLLSSWVVRFSRETKWIFSAPAFRLFFDTHRKQHFRWTIQRMPVSLEKWKHANVSRFSDLLQQKKMWLDFFTLSTNKEISSELDAWRFQEDALSFPGLSLELLFQLNDQDTSFLFCFVQ